MSDTAQKLCKEQKRAKALRENLLRRKPIVKSKINGSKNVSNEETKCLTIHECSLISGVADVENNNNNNKERDNSDDSIG